MQKSILLSAVLLFSGVVFAQECVENVCVGDTVIDSSNTIGRVESVANGVVKYRTTYSTYESRPDNLSRRIPSNKFPDGHKVIDQSNTIGTVAMVFENGKVQYKTTYSTYISDNVSPEVESVNGISVNDTVIDSSNTIGKVSAVFENGKKQYKTTYSTYIANDLSREVQQLGSLRKGVNVLDGSNTAAVVDRVFDNGKVSYKTTYSTYIQPSSYLSAETELNSSLQKGNRVIDSSNTIGEIKAVYENGKVRYSTPYSTYTSADVSPEVNVSRGVSAGQVVLSASDEIMRVDGVFANGKMKGKTAYSSSIVNTEDVSRESDSHPKYNKDDLYANNRASIGKISRFFENGKVELNGQANSELFAEVQELDGVKKDVKVINNLLAQVTVKNVFENGALATTEGPNLLLKSVGDLNDNLKQNILTNLIWNSRNSSSPSQYAFREEELPELKKALVDYLLANKKQFSKEDISLLLKILDGENAKEEEPAITANDLNTTSDLKVNVNNQEMKKIVEDTIKAGNLGCSKEDGVRASSILDVQVISTTHQCTITMSLKRKMGFSETTRVLITDKNNLVGSLKNFCKKRMKEMTEEIFE